MNAYYPQQYERQKKMLDSISIALHLGWMMEKSRQLLLETCCQISLLTFSQKDLNSLSFDIRSVGFKWAMIPGA